MDAPDKSTKFFPHVAYCMNLTFLVGTSLFAFVYGRYHGFKMAAIQDTYDTGISASKSLRIQSRYPNQHFQGQGILSRYYDVNQNCHCKC